MGYPEGVMKQILPHLILLIIRLIPMKYGCDYFQISWDLVQQFLKTPPR